MVEIPLPPRSHHKAKKLTDEEQERRNKRLESSFLALNEGLGNSKSDQECFTKIVSRDLQKKFQETVYPVCPKLCKLMTKEESNRLAIIAHCLNESRKSCYNTPDLLVWDSIVRILLVFEGLIQLKPDLKTEVVKYAHTENLLKGRLDLIRKDLSALPQSLEKDFPKTSDECKELIEKLKIAELAYGGQTYAYIVPHGLEDGNWVTFGAWREQQINSTNFCDSAEMLGLTLHYPAEAIRVMYTLHKKLSPLAVKILPEQALAENQRNANFKKMFEEFSAELTKPARGGKTKDKKPGQPKNKEAAKSIDSLKKLLEDKSKFSDIPKGTKRESWEWIADKIGYPKNPQNDTPRHKIMQGYLRRNSPKLYGKLKNIVKKN